MKVKHRSNNIPTDSIFNYTLIHH